MGVIALAKRASALANPTSTSAFVRADDATKAAICYLPGSSKLDNRSFLVRVVGKATGGTTTNLTINVKVGTSATDGSNTAFMSSGALALNSASGNFVLEGLCSWDVTSSKIEGIVYGHLNSVTIPQAAATAVASTSPVTEGLGLVASALFSASNAGNTVTISELSVSDVG